MGPRSVFYQSASGTFRAGTFEIEKGHEEMKTLWRYGALLAVVLSIGIVVGYSGPDLPPGPYCGVEPNKCCTGREDECSAPILDGKPGTLCYCDDFCNRTSSPDDCCPDYFQVCHGVTPPQETRTCLHNNKVVPINQKVKENCNECVCQKVGERVEIVCDQNPCMVDEDVIDSINSNRRNTWRAKRHDPFWGRTLSDGIKLRLGTLDPEKSTRGMYPVKPEYDPNTIPKFFNSADQWRNLINPIHDQGWCGSSWAISTVDVASDKFAINSDGKETPLLSTQQLISCNNRGQKACDGGYLDRAWQFIRKFGLVNEECFPYTGKIEKCKISNRVTTLVAAGCTPPISPENRKNRYKVSPAIRMGNVMDVMYEISTNGPVQATMKVYQDFFMYGGGIYKKSSDPDDIMFGYHSVRIVGWGEENGVEYWTVANSWGPEWGENGYFRIVRGVNECDIESYIISTLAFTVDNRVGVEG